MEVAWKAYPIEVGPKESAKLKPAELEEPEESAWKTLPASKEELPVQESREVGLQPVRFWLELRSPEAKLSPELAPPEV
jgi:hypothetical protein